ncbi:DNA polymerase III subunit gamma/tau [Alteromonas sp. KUL49]|uniref:DNA polymerase III subunit gamma/tau n=1 Tax=Alteromonas sp. KUL49 TaxID=2480798 RepID=UPI00102EEFE1|nr:DNA polymerase III subunit gamma/tau [Alteromonas sp. KUL49]TAP34142.1 DNA polymerase III subunit gamma/tau [Alteromonas sp. KUL49]GEA13629.1 hypothetical protein KUL49_40040 [Alteromonas sp. KUL49]
MSYQVLARKWRPGKFSELVGQEHVVSAISNALDNDRLHHAYLFTGTRGVGKTTIARIFSKSLNCDEGQGANPCGKCSTCVEIEQGRYVDLLEIDAASRTKVEDTRELLDNVQYKPTRGRYKVYLIDEVHMLSKHSFNALLKTLEEPPPHVKFLLATTDPQKLPITILSRCLQFNLKALSREQISGQLTHILGQESISFEAPALTLLARAAQGSMRDALSLTDQAIAQGGNQVTASVVTDMLGLMDKNVLLKLLHSVVSKTPAEVMALVEALAEQAPDYDQVFAELNGLLHQIALTQWVPEACKLETTFAKAIYQLAKSIPAEQVQLLYQIVLQGRKDLPLAADGRSALEMTLLRMMTFAPKTPLADIDDVISSQAPTGSGNVPIASASAAPVQSAEAVSVTESPVTERATTEPSVEEPVTETSVEEAPVVPQEAPAAEQASAQVNETTEQPTTEVVQEATVAEQAEPASEPQNGFMGEEFPPVEQMEPYPPVENYHHDDMLPPESEPYIPEHQNVTAPQNQLSEEQQLTSTSEMLALRQRMKQRREEEPEAAVKKSSDDTPSLAALKRPQPEQDQSANEPLDAAPIAQEFKAEQSPAPQPQAPQPQMVEPEPALQSASPVDDTPPWESSAPQFQEEAHTSAPEPISQESAPQEAPFNHQENQNLEVTYNGDLKAYLDDGSKLVHASQIDQWSNLVEQLPLAGLLKQLVLNATFSREGDQVSLEIDQSQSHLINDSAKQQVVDALHHALGEGVSVSMSLGNPDKTPLQLQQDIQVMRLDHAKNVVQTDDQIQTLLASFDASVVEASIKPR